jgi:hypothetical protein
MQFLSTALSFRMACPNCGRPAAEFPSFCLGCRMRHRQHPAGQTGLWGKFIPTSSGNSRRYDFASRPVYKQAFFSGWWPFKLLFFPAWAFWQLIRLARLPVSRIKL